MHTHVHTHENMHTRREKWTQNESEGKKVALGLGRGWVPTCGSEWMGIPEGWHIVWLSAGPMHQAAVPAPLPGMGSKGCRCCVGHPERTPGEDRSVMATPQGIPPTQLPAAVPAPARGLCCLMEPVSSALKQARVAAMLEGNKDSSLFPPALGNETILPCTPGCLFGMPKGLALQARAC